MASKCESFDVEKLPLFLNAVLDKAQFIFREKNQDLSTLDSRVVVDSAYKITMAVLMQMIWNNSIRCPRFMERPCLQ